MAQRAVNVGRKGMVKYLQDALENCHLKHLHTKCPEGYLEWHAWAESKMKTHRQVKCECCGRFAIWVKK